MGIIQPSYGYPGSFTVDPVLWASLQQTLGKHYMVRDAGSLFCTPLQSGTRQVQLSAGEFGGYGVFDRNDGTGGNATITLPSVSTGTQWFLICARRTWGTTKATSFVAVPGPIQTAEPTSMSQFPTREEGAGDVDDQPLWLVPLTAGNTVPGTPVDVRLIGTDGSYEAFSDFVLTYATWPGIELVIRNAKRYRRGTDALTLGAVWHSTSLAADVNEALKVYTQAEFVQSVAEWSVTQTGLKNVCRRRRNFYDFTLQSIHNSSSASGEAARLKTISASSDNFPDTIIAKLLPAFAPPEDIPIQLVYRGTTSATDTTVAVVGGMGTIDTSGNVRIVSGAANYGINLESSSASGATSWSVRMHFSYFKGDTA